MLKKRLIPVIVVHNGLLVQSYNFNRYLPIGKAKIAVDFFTDWDVDEIILLDITATKNGTPPNTAFIKSLSQRTQIPLTVGGGIRNEEDIRSLLHAGADKVCINHNLRNDPKQIRKYAAIFGKQCIVGSIDIAKDTAGDYKVYDYVTSRMTDTEPIALAKQFEAEGLGELFINSVDRDGSKQGYDIAFLNDISNAVSIPVIGCGGVGTMQHFVEAAKKTHIDGLAAANIFQFMEHSTVIAKSILKKSDIAIRIDTPFDYTDRNFSDYGRLNKRRDEDLEKIVFSSIETEEI